MCVTCVTHLYTLTHFPLCFIITIHHHYSNILSLSHFQIAFKAQKRNQSHRSSYSLIDIHFWSSCLWSKLLIEALCVLWSKVDHNFNSVKSDCFRFCTCKLSFSLCKLFSVRLSRFLLIKIVLIKVHFIYNHILLIASINIVLTD